MELVDVLDSKSCEVQPSCRFDPGHRHHKKAYLIGLFILFVSIKKRETNFVVFLRPVWLERIEVLLGKVGNISAFEG